jgi:predicted RNase H-like HicB family nuclease
MNLTIECEHEDDGRWIAEIVQIPGAMAYGATRDEAMAKAEVVALRAIADRIEHGEAKPLDVQISLAAA